MLIAATANATAAAGGAVAAVAIAAGAAAAAAIAAGAAAAGFGFGTVAIALLVGGGSIKGGERSDVTGRRSGEETRDVDISARGFLLRDASLLLPPIRKSIFQCRDGLSSPLLFSLHLVLSPYALTISRRCGTRV